MALLGGLTVKEAEETLGHRLIPLIVAITDRAEKTVKAKLNKAARHTRVASVFADVWAESEQSELGCYSVVLARMLDAAEDLPGVTGLSHRAVVRRLNRANGHSLLKNVFRDNWPDDADRLLDDGFGGFGDMTAGFVRRLNLVSELAEALGRNASEIAKVLEGAHGNTRIRRVFAVVSTTDTLAEDLHPTPSGPPSSPIPVSPSVHVPPIPQALIKAARTDRLVLFVGAGVSAAAGLPSWSGLIKEIRDRSGVALDGEDEGELNDLVAEGALVSALTLLKGLVGQNVFGDLVAILLDDKGREIPVVAEAIADLGPHLWCVITTNLDRILARAFAGSWEELISAPAGVVQHHTGYILKLHGTLSSRHSWVLTRDQYDGALYRNPSGRDAMKTLFRSCTILFVGYGLKDQDFDPLLQEMRALWSDQPAQHYALLAEVPKAKQRLTDLRAAGVEPILYKNTDGQHQSVAAFLSSLHASISSTGS
ncbi:MAG: SIR2 family protein [Myxococcota bacterium]